MHISCGGLPDGFYDTDLVSLFTACLKAGCEIKIAVWNDTISVISKELRKLAAEQTERFHLYWSSHKGEIFNHLPHFLVVGDCAYRQEAVHDDLSTAKWDEFSPEVPARIDFGDTEGAKSLLELFKHVWKACSPVCRVA